LSQFHDLPVGCSSSSCNSSKIIKRSFNCSPNSRREKLKCPQLAATSSRSASVSGDLIFEKLFRR
jgi:hypothetical protein